MRRFVGLCAVALWALGSPQTAWADEPAPTNASKIKTALDEFNEASINLKQKDYANAAVHYENAFYDAPRARTLYLVIFANRASGQLARAATFAALALQKYKGDKTIEPYAQEVLTTLSPQVHEVMLECKPVCSVAADEHAVPGAETANFRFFLDPGKHTIVVSWSEERTQLIPLAARAGGRDTYKREAPPIPVKPPPPNTSGYARLPTTDSVAAPQPPEVVSTKPLHPAFFFVGLGLTAVAGGLTIASGIDTINNPGTSQIAVLCKNDPVTSCPAYQEGLSKQRRTNIGIGITSGLGALTAVFGIFLTQWSNPHKKPTKTAAVGLHVAPVFGFSEVGVAGTF